MDTCYPYQKRITPYQVQSLVHHVNYQMMQAKIKNWELLISIGKTSFVFKN